MHLKPIQSADPSRTPNGFRPAYNLFRRKRHLDLFCAVPEDYPVPAFVDGHWEYAGKVDGTSAAPRGFESKAAKDVVPLTGFYLFTALRAERPIRDARSMRLAA